jgi:hypothetical protein
VALRSIRASGFRLVPEFLKPGTPSRGQGRYGGHLVRRETALAARVASSRFTDLLQSVRRQWHRQVSSDAQISFKCDLLQGELEVEVINTGQGSLSALALLVVMPARLGNPVSWMIDEASIARQRIVFPYAHLSPTIAHSIEVRHWPQPIEPGMAEVLRTRWRTASMVNLRSATTIGISYLEAGRHLVRTADGQLRTDLG